MVAQASSGARQSARGRKVDGDLEEYDIFQTAS
jgi:hypothetical protein